MWSSSANASRPATPLGRVGSDAAAERPIKALQLTAGASSKALTKVRFLRKADASWYHSSQAPVAQLDRAPDFESGGQGFESLPARQQASYEAIIFFDAGIRLFLSSHKCPSRFLELDPPVPPRAKLRRGEVLCSRFSVPNFQYPICIKDTLPLSLSGVKRTWPSAVQMCAYDPQQTWAVALHRTEMDCAQNRAVRPNIGPCIVMSNL